MQTGSEQLKSQQRVMESRGFYNGKIDGVWGPKTIAAKQKWERSGKFAPAIPNNGFPLPDRGPFPPGVRRLADGTLTCVEAEAKGKAAPAPEVKPAEVKAPFPVPQQQAQTTQNEEPAPPGAVMDAARPDRPNKVKIEGDKK